MAGWSWKCGITMAVLSLIIYMLLTWAASSYGSEDAGKLSLNELPSGSSVGQMAMSMEVVLFVSIFLAWQANSAWFGCGMN